MNNHFKNYPFFLFSIIALFSIDMNAQSSSLGIFENHIDIGSVKHSGSAKYNPTRQEYTIQGAGTNMWFGEDEFHFLWKSIQGDFILRAELEFIGEGVDAHRKAGWMIRKDFTSGSQHVNASVHGDGLTSLQFRKKPAGDTEEIQSPDKSPTVVQLERKNNTFIVSTATFGHAFTSVQLIDFDLPNDLFVGLYVCSHNPDVVEKVVFRNVRIIKPTPEDFQPYRDYIGSKLEILDIESGNRKVLMSSAHSIQAPNWTTDGKELIYNSNGLLYRYGIEDGSTTLINTGFANKNNNDHVLSFDGQQLAISHHNAEDNNNSTIYILPTEGSSNPKKITKKGVGASYLHGWSPDEKSLVFTGNRNNQYDIIKVNIKTGKETPLTNEKKLDDGSEYSPDGKYIYFNSARSGNMQLWRMKSNGKKPKQLTFDDFNNWFPHVSPDNKWIVFLSYPPEVDPEAHPFYKHVLIRMMPVEGGETKIIGYLYGGQGTMNVPNWSPDSKKIAFVSNSN